MVTSKDRLTEEEEHRIGAALSIPITDDGVVIRPALEMLSRLRQGRVMDMLSVELNRVVNGVKDCSANKGGTVTLTLSITPVQKQTNAVFIQAKVVGKAPEDPPETDLLFYDDDGNLHTRDPNQRDIFEDGPAGVNHGA